MSNILVIAKKELVDHVSDRTFLLCFGVLLAAMIVGAYTHVGETQDWTFQESAQGHVHEEGYAWKVTARSIPFTILDSLTSLGTLLAIAVSFNSVNKERVEGSLRVLMSYPLRKSSLILGKLLGSIAVVSLAVLASMTISFTIVMFYLGIPLTSDFLLRIASITALGITLLTFFLCLGMAISSLIPEPSTALIGIVLITFLFQATTISMILIITAGALLYLGVVIKLPPALVSNPNMSIIFESSTQSLALLSPTESFRVFTNELFEFQREFYNPPEIMKISFEWLLSRNLVYVEAIVIFTFASIIVCYVAFARSRLT